MAAIRPPNQKGANYEMGTCECGCAGETAGGKSLPGHDQKFPAEIERRVGGLLSVSKLVGFAEDYVSGRVSLTDLGPLVSELMRTASTRSRAETP